MKINVKGVSNGYIVESEKSDYYSDETKNTIAVHNDDKALKEYLGNLIYSYYMDSYLDGDNEINIELS